MLFQTTVPLITIETGRDCLYTDIGDYLVRVTFIAQVAHKLRSNQGIIMKIEINKPWIILAVVLFVLILILASGYKLGRVRLPGGIEIDLIPPTSPERVDLPAPQKLQSTSESHTPVILEIVETQEHKNKELILHKDIYFSDPAGDAYLVAYKLISTNNISSSAITVDDDEIQAAPDEQISRAFVTGTWKCGAKSSMYSIVLEARILDKAGNQSEPTQITFACE